MYRNFANMPLICYCIKDLFLQVRKQGILIVNPLVDETEAA